MTQPTNDDILDADEPLPRAASKRALTVAQAADDADFERLERFDTLEPGFYWTAVKAVDRVADEGATLLLTELIEFEGRVHSVRLLMHPRDGRGHYTVMVRDFLDSFVPCHDGEAIRQREQQAVMQEVAEQQAELMRVQSDPKLMLEATKELIEKLSSEEERQAARDGRSATENQRKREQNIGKVHRRAARRSAAKGNPLTTPRIAVSSEVGGLISGGINEEGVAELTKLASQQAIVARAQSTWLESKTRAITNTLSALAPFIEERSAVALARASGAIKMAERIKRGIESLDLYTGKGVDVFDIRTGKEASSSEPLTIIQEKRYAEEEFAVWADVDESFDFHSKKEFFEAIASNDSLMKQVLPTPRCVVSIAMTRERRHYGNPLEEVLYNIQNQLVFLLVRNGDNVHVVYSNSPSHEGAARLFPTADDLESHFTGMDGSRVSIRDIEFGDAAKSFDNMDIVYRRFLILLCGLDHRLQLFGDFYPAEQQLDFMSLDFQARYFRFIADGEGIKLGNDLVPLAEWMGTRNAQAQSGSRIFVLDSAGMKAASPEFKRRSTLTPVREQFKTPFIAAREGQRLYLTVMGTDRYAGRPTQGVKCYLDGADNDSHSYQGAAWWLCVDDVDVEMVRRYRHSRVTRSMGVAYLRLFRRIEAYLDAELQAERGARGYLLSNAVEHGGLTDAQARSAIGNAVRNWRASRRGKALPTLADKAALNEVLSLMIPAGHLSSELTGLLDDYLAKSGIQPLLLTRSGKAKLVLYVAPTDDDKAPYPAVLRWGWVRRLVLKAGKTRISEESSSLQWLTQTLPASEVTARRWPELDTWLNTHDEPITLRRYAEIGANLRDSVEWDAVLRGGEGVGFDPDFFTRLHNSIRDVHTRNKSGYVSSVYWSIPVTLHSSDGVKASLNTMQERAETVLWFYGNEEQRKLVETVYVRRFGRASGQQNARMTLRSQVNWQLAFCKNLGQRHDVATAESSMFSSSRAAWKSHEIKVNDRGHHYEYQGEKRTLSAQPKTRPSTSKLSLNRCLLQLTGVAPKQLRRAFYLGTEERTRRALWNLTYGSRTREENMTEEQYERECKAIKRRVQEERYRHHYTCMASPLVWDADRRKPLANAVFSAPVIAANKRRESEQSDG